jgi:hypothetical protein
MDCQLLSQAGLRCAVLSSVRVLIAEAPLFGARTGPGIRTIFWSETTWTQCGSNPLIGGFAFILVPARPPARG